MSSGAYSSLVLSFGICGGVIYLNNENFPYGKFGKRKRGRHQPSVLAVTYCKKEAYQDGSLSVARIVFAGMFLLLKGLCTP